MKRIYILIFIIFYISMSCFSLENKEVAFQNWLYHFGFHGHPLEIGKNLKGIHSPPVFAIVNEKEIIIAITRAETEGEEWNKNIKDIENIFAQDSYITMNVGGGGPLIWETKSKGF